MAKAKLYEPGKNMVIDVALGFVTAQVLLNLGTTLYTNIVSPLVNTIPEEGDLTQVFTEIGEVTLLTGNVLNVLLFVVTVLLVTGLFLKILTMDFTSKRASTSTTTAPAKKTTTTKKKTTKKSSK